VPTIGNVKAERGAVHRPFRCATKHGDEPCVLRALCSEVFSASMASTAAVLLTEQ
jgi:hypothetical protein